MKVAKRTHYCMLLILSVVITTHLGRGEPSRMALYTLYCVNYATLCQLRHTAAKSYAPCFLAGRATPVGYLSAEGLSGARSAE
jgi:hypothetical protein